jgi:hypothetical protein
VVKSFVTHVVLIGIGVLSALLLFNALDNHFSAAGHREFAKQLVDPALRDRTRNLYARAEIER